MKKIILTSILMASAMLVSAQCVEVRGIETKIVKYWEENYEFLGFEFKNNNSFIVSIDAELWKPNVSDARGVKNPDSIEKTKSFDINPNESYVWKTQICQTHYSNGECLVSTSDPTNGKYIKFKALKCQR